MEIEVVEVVLGPSNYQICCKNSTEISYTFGVYQFFPKSPGLDSLAWKTAGVPPSGQVSIGWEMTYGVAISDWDSGPVAEQQIVSADLGKVYKITTTNGNIPGILPTGDTTDDDKIDVGNNTNLTMNVGFVLDGDVLTQQRNVEGGEIVTFKMHPATSQQFYVACYHSNQVGCVVDSDRSLSPVMVNFKDDFTSCIVEVTYENGMLVLKDPDFKWIAETFPPSP